VLCLGAFALGLAAGRPGHVLKPLVVVGSVFTFAFGSTLKPVRQACQDAELRKTVARDL
jgi:hypothetical protein